MYSSNIARSRFSGLSSGIDVQALVQSALQSYYNKIDTANKQKILTEWKQTAYRDLNTQLTDFKNKYFSYSSSETTLRSNASMNAKKISYTDNSYVKITATSLADTDTHTITGVEVATRATAASEKIKQADGTSYTSSDLSGKTLSELSEVFGAGKFAEADADGNYKVSLIVNDKAKEFTFSGDTTVSDFMKEINNSGIDGKLSFNEFSRSFELKTNNTGKAQNVAISGAMFVGSGEAMTAEDENGNSITVAGVSNRGKNASITIDGEKHESSTNTFTIGGLTFQTLADSKEDTPLNINATVTKDTDSIMAKIKSFVNDYNTLIADLNKKYSERKTSYLPLLSEEKQDMKDSEIEEWDNKAKQGMFYNDSTISRLLSGMRSVFSQSDVGGSGRSLSSIGITTGTYETKGQLIIDEDKLKAALENDTDAVAKIFAGKGGLAETFANKLDNAVDTIRDVTLSGFTSKIKSYDNSISNLNRILEQKEDALYDKYTTMETTIAKLQSQMNSLGLG